MHHLAAPEDSTKGRTVKAFVIVVNSCCLSAAPASVRGGLHAVGGVWTNATTEGAIFLGLVDMVGMAG